VRDVEVSWSYRELEDRVDRAAARFTIGAATTLALGSDAGSVALLFGALAASSRVVLHGPEHAGQVPRVVAPTPADDALVVLPTSGSTGDPKWVAHTHETIAGALRNTLVLRRQPLGFDEETLRGRALEEALDALVLAEPSLTLTVIAGMPLWSISGFNVVQLTLLTGGQLVLCPSEPAAVLDAIERSAVTNIGVPPILLRGLLREQRRRPRDLSSLIVAGVGGGPLDPALARAVEAELGCLVMTAYGSTELGGAALMPRFDDAVAVRTETVGRPLPGVDARLADARGHDRVGELVVRTASCMVGYVGHDGVVTPTARDEFLATGDLASVDRDGNVRVVGRVDDQILRGGRLIDPAPIEAVLEQHAGVERAAAVGVPSRVPGEHDIWVAYTPALGAAVDDRALRELCHASLPAFSRPRRIVVMIDLPRRRDGSPHRRAVLARLLSE
jgi:acyl-coenzyme A synthetase/AMP-(fatty) acid ligase